MNTYLCPTTHCVFALQLRSVLDVFFEKKMPSSEIVTGRQSIVFGEFSIQSPQIPIPDPL